MATDEASCSQAINQLYCAVMLYLEAFRHLGYARPRSCRKTFQRQEKLVLAGLGLRAP